jgi:hypothetical protein
MTQKRCGEDGTCCGSPTGCGASDNPHANAVMLFVGASASVMLVAMLIAIAIS